MKKNILITMVFIFAAFVTGFAQQTSAPDQGSTNKAAVITSASNTVVSTNAATNAVADTNASTNAVSPEKEVVPAAGVVYNDGKFDYASPDVKFVINAKDEGSGVKEIFVMADDSEFGVYNKPLSFYTEGKHLIGYKVEDNVENISPFKSYEFIMDMTPPTAVLSSDKKVIKIGEVVYVGSNYNFGIDANDTLSGVKSIEYGLDDAAAVAYNKPFVAIGTNGMHKITYKATDNVGNASENKSYLFFMDLNAPTLDFVIEPNIYETNGVKYISSSALIKMIAKDAETGVANISYSIDGGESKDFTYPIKLTSGAHTIKAKAYDMVGNVSEEKTLSVTVDSVNPEADLVPTK